LEEEAFEIKIGARGNPIKTQKFILDIVKRFIDFDLEIPEGVAQIRDKKTYNLIYSYESTPIHPAYHYFYISSKMLPLKEGNLLYDYIDTSYDRICSVPSKTRIYKSKKYIKLMQVLTTNMCEVSKTLGRKTLGHKTTLYLEIKTPKGRQVVMELIFPKLSRKCPKKIYFLNNYAYTTLENRILKSLNKVEPPIKQINVFRIEPTITNISATFKPEHLDIIKDKKLREKAYEVLDFVKNEIETTECTYTIKTGDSTIPYVTFHKDVYITNHKVIEFTTHNASISVTIRGREIPLDIYMKNKEFYKKILESQPVLSSSYHNIRRKTFGKYTIIYKDSDLVGYIENTPRKKIYEIVKCRDSELIAAFFNKNPERVFIPIKRDIENLPQTIKRKIIKLLMVKRWKTS